MVACCVSRVVRSPDPQFPDTQRREAQGSDADESTASRAHQRNILQFSFVIASPTSVASR